MARRLLLVAAICAAMGLGGAGLIRMMGAAATEFRIDGDRLVLSGPLTGAATDRLERFLQQNPNLTHVVLADTPGAHDLGWLLGMADLIAAHGLATEARGSVGNDAILLFLAGQPRVISGGALFFYDDGEARRRGAPWDCDPASAAERLDFITATLGDDTFAAFYDQTRRAQPAYQLTADDIQRFGLE
ncbi:MAG: hypothetical protein AAGF88_08705 [Pseudomonadota bacterium]